MSEAHDAVTRNGRARWRGLRRVAVFLFVTGFASNMLSRPDPPAGKSAVVIVDGTPVALHLSRSSEGIVLGLQSASTGIPFEVFATPSLNGVMVESLEWIWLGTIDGPAPATVTHPDWPCAFYLLGSCRDSDLDGLSDAVERLVVRTSPALPDTDKDGVSDRVEHLQGRNPRVPGAVPDPHRRVDLEVFTPLE